MKENEPTKPPNTRMEDNISEIWDHQTSEVEKNRSHTGQDGDKSILKGWAFHDYKLGAIMTLHVLGK